MGGKPNPGTKKDMRLSRNNPHAGKPKSKPPQKPKAQSGMKTIYSEKD